MKKDKKESRLKKQALKSFLQTSATPTSAISESDSKRQTTDNTEDAYEEYVQEMNNCNVCGKELEPAKRKKCIFCGMPACSQHLRKKRRKKGKWERICDSCEDRVIYDFYMKLENKAEEALAVQEEIVHLKHENYEREVQEKREKRSELAFKTMELQRKHQEKMVKLTDDENMLMSHGHKVESQQLEVEQLQTYVKRVETAFKTNSEQDHRVLSEQNKKLAKELAKIQKKCLEVRSLIEKREKEIEEAFESWQRKQFRQQLQEQKTKKGDKCVIY